MKNLEVPDGHSVVQEAAVYCEKGLKGKMQEPGIDSSLGENLIVSFLSWLAQHHNIGQLCPFS